MEPKIQSSFIPKQPISPTPVAKKTGGSGGPMSLVFMLTLALFVLALLLSGGVFFYQQFVEANIQKKSNELEQARAIFEPALIQELRRLDLRMETAEALVNDHTAASLMFEFLETITVVSVQYDTLNYSVLGDGQIDVVLDGKARSFNALALQSDLFGESEFVKEPLFSNIGVSEEGDVLFSLSASLDPRLVDYESGLPEVVEEEFEEPAEETVSDETTEVTGTTTPETDDDELNETTP